MKKSELKQLIREVIEEVNSSGADFDAYDTQGKKLEIEKSWEEACPECGEDYNEIYFVPDWGTHRCEVCLDKELEKYHYKVAKKS